MLTHEFKVLPSFFTSNAHFCTRTTFSDHVNIDATLFQNAGRNITSQANRLFFRPKLYTQISIFLVALPSQP